MDNLTYLPYFILLGQLFLTRLSQEKLGVLFFCDGKNAFGSKTTLMSGCFFLGIMQLIELIELILLCV